MKKRNTMLLVAAIAAVMLAGCTPETAETLAPDGETPTVTESSMPATLVGTQWVRHADEWLDVPGYAPMHMVITWRWIFQTDSTGIVNASGEGAENFPAADINMKSSYRYDAEAGVLDMVTYTSAGNDTMISTYNAEMDAFVTNIGDYVYYRDK